MHQQIACFFIFILLTISFGLQASPSCIEWLATAISVQGKIDTQYSESFNWNPIIMGHRFCYGDKVRTSKYSRVTLVFKNGSRITLDQNSTLSFSSTTQKKTSWIITLIRGSSFIRSRQSQRLNVQTPFINAVHEGTEFLVSVDSKKTEISVFDGQVIANNQMGEIYINKGYTGIATKNQSPSVQALTVKPEDAVQWSLYYPPVIDVVKYKKSIFHSAIKAYQQGDAYQALALLETFPSVQQDSSYLSLKASILLTLGSINEAKALIEHIRLLEPKNSTALALQSIIEVTKNRQGKAFGLALKAVKLDPKSATAQIALSYAYQAQFNIVNALTATKKAVQFSTDNALAWARLAELQLSNGDRKAALKSAQKATSLNPFLARTQTVLGFNYLAQINIDKAQGVFSRAIKLDSTDPLVHLGLGLTKIRKGEIQAGTNDIETAVSLDPNSAIMRSYLGKAYYELRNNEYAATELNIAKEIDPKDPTPWFYDAIRKQTANKPVEALHDMQKAIELNGNRGVYRSKLLLDEDSAARSANMARIYQDLDFNRVALKQAWTSLSQDYTNPSAHRFLSDTLQGKPRHRVARASELLQAQLFQPINTVPVQPQLSSENIDILNSTGPGSLSSNEYDPLFTSNGAHILLNGAVGSNNTLTDSSIISGVYDQLSLSFGQFHYQTDGFRINDDYKQNIYNIFAQLAITNDLNIQAEFKTEDVKAGDVALRFDGFHQDNFRDSTRQNTARLGLHYKINNQQDFVLSTFLTEFNENVKNRKFTQDKPNIIPFFGTLVNSSITNTSTKAHESGYQLEAQYLFHPEFLNFTVGFAYLNLNSGETTLSQRDDISQLLPTPPLLPFPTTTISNPEIKQPFNQDTNIYTGYFYSQLDITNTFTSILGMSIDIYNDNLVATTQLNPKIGFIWSPMNKLTVRSAIFRTLKKPLVSSQTIEATQISGFNQFFDDFNGTTSWNYGLGIDFIPIESLYLGGEITWRNSNQPTLLNNNISFQSRNESAHLAYLYWAPLSWLTLSSEYKFLEFHRDYILNNVDNLNPRSISSHQIPISINFYHSSGVFSKFSTTFVKQNIEYVNKQNGTDKQTGNFWVFDSTIGFRFSKRLGSLSLEVKNLFNNNFNYHSEFDASGSQITKFVPEREIFLKLNLTF